jgi:hypothetical protein
MASLLEAAAAGDDAADADPASQSTGQVGHE